MLCTLCSRVFPNEEMDQFAMTVRQVARTLWAVHVTLQMGFEEEVCPVCHLNIMSPRLKRNLKPETTTLVLPAMHCCADVLQLQSRTM